MNNNPDFDDLADLERMPRTDRRRFSAKSISLALRLSDCRHYLPGFRRDRGFPGEIRGRFDVHRAPPHLNVLKQDQDWIYGRESPTEIEFGLQTSALMTRDRRTLWQTMRD